MDLTQAQILATLIGSSCQMYNTSAQLFHEGMIQDSNSVAAKAKTLLNKALLDAGVNEPNMSNADIPLEEQELKKHWENAITGLRKFQRGDLLSESETIGLKTVDRKTLGAMFPDDITKLEAAGIVSPIAP